MPERQTITLTELQTRLADHALTYRQLDYWARHGLIECEGGGQGTGYKRSYFVDELPIIVFISKAMHLGLTTDDLIPILALHGNDIRQGKLHYLSVGVNKDLQVFDYLDMETLHFLSKDGDLAIRIFNLQAIQESIHNA